MLDDQYELPDTIAEEEAVISLEAVAQDIDNFLGQVKEVGGVSRGMAEKAAHLLPAETNFAYYSSTPTKTQLKVTLEAIDIKTALLIAGAVLAVAVLAVKIVKYIKDSRRKLEKTFETISGYDKGIERCFKICDKISSGLSGEAKLKVAAIEKELRDQVAERINVKYSPIIKDALTNGKVTNTIASAGKIADELFSHLEFSVNVLDKLVNDGKVDVDHKSIIDPLDLALPDSLSSIYKSTVDRAGSAMSEIGQDLQKANETRIPFVGTFEDFYKANRKYMGSNSVLSGKGMWKVTQLQTTLEKLEKKTSGKKDLDVERRTEITKISNAVRSGVQQLLAYQRMVMMLASESKFFWYNVERYAATKLKRVSALALQSDDPEVKEALMTASKIKTD